MQMILQVIVYLFPALMAFAILYFFAGKSISSEPDYAKMKKGNDMILTALAAMFVILSIWAIVHSIVATIA